MIPTWVQQIAGASPPPTFQPSLDFSDDSDGAGPDRNSQYVVFFALINGFEGT